MDVRAASLGGVPLLETTGEIDHGTCAGLEAALREALAAGSGIILIDLTHVSYIDSGGLSVLFSAQRELRENGWLGLIGPNADIHRLLELVGVFADPSMRVFENHQAALAAIAGRPGAG